MNEIKSIIDDIGIAAFESKTNIAALAVISDNGTLIYQTENWNVSDDLESIMNALKGEKVVVLNQSEYNISESYENGLIGSNPAGMGYIFIVFFDSGLLLSYALPQADPSTCFTFLSTNVNSLDGKVK
jgi:hypothetical protein